MAGSINVDVVYALADEQALVSLRMPAGSTLLDAVRASGLTGRYALDEAALVLGVFGKVDRAPAARVLVEGDRVEIYRPLTLDPKERRRRRAAAGRRTRRQ